MTWMTSMTVSSVAARLMLRPASWCSSGASHASSLQYSAELPAEIAVIRQAVALRHGRPWVVGPVGVAARVRSRERGDPAHSAVPISASAAQDATAVGHDPKALASGTLAPAAATPRAPARRCTGR